MADGSAAGGGGAGRDRHGRRRRRGRRRPGGRGPEPGPRLTERRHGLDDGLHDYYEFGTGDDDTFGYFQGGVRASVPLAFVPRAYGAWSLQADLTVLVLGDNLRAVNDGDRTQVIGTLGVAFAY